MEFNSVGTKLSVKSGTETAYKETYGLYNVPEMGGSTEYLDVTNLGDSHKRTVPGISDYGSPEFQYYNTKDDTDSATLIMQTWETFRTWQLAGTVVGFKLEYPDGSGFTWSGKVSVRKESTGVNQPMKFKLTTSVESEIEDVDAI